MGWCCVPFCKSTKKKSCSNIGVSFHEFPCNEEQRKRWLLNIHRKDWLPSDRSKVCSLHFTSDDFLNGLKVRRLKRDAIPTVFSDYPEYLQRAARKRKMRNRPKIRQPFQKKVKIIKPKLFPEAPLQALHCEQLVEVISTKELHETKISFHETSDGPEKLNLKPIESNETNNGLENVEPDHNYSYETNKTSENVEPDHNYSCEVNVNNNIQSENLKPVNLPLLGRPCIAPNILKQTIRSLRAKNYKLQKQLTEARAKISELKQAERKSEFSSLIDEITAEAESGSLQSIFLLDQLKTYKCKRPKWSEPTLKYCSQWRLKSPPSYKFVENCRLMKLPAKSTLQRYITQGDCVSVKPIHDEEIPLETED